MKKINIFKYSIVAVLLAIVFLFTSCSSTNALKDALLLENISNYQLTMKVDAGGTTQSYTIEKDTNKLKVTIASTINYYELGENFYIKYSKNYYGSYTKTTINSSIYNSNENFIIDYNAFIRNVDTSKAKYDTFNKCYNLDYSGDYSGFQTTGKASFYLTDNKLEKFTYDLTSSQSFITLSYIITGTVTYNPNIIILPEVTEYYI